MASHETQSGGTGATPGGPDQLAGSRAEGFYAVGMEHFASHRWTEAAAEFGKALALHPRHSGALKHLGFALFHAGQFSRALNSLHQYMEREPDDEQTLLYSGKAYLELVRYPEAERILRRLLSVNPRSVQGYGVLGSICYRRGLYTDAVAMFRKALELEPEEPELFFSLGEAYNKLDQVSQAVECFETVLKIQPENPKVYYNLGILYDKKGMPDKASLMYRQAKDLSVPGGERRPKTAPVTNARDKGLFFSRSLTVVADDQECVARSGVDAGRYEKLRRRQRGRKQSRFTPEVEITGETAGTMDLTKASLKIEEAIRNIKEKRN